MPAIAPPPPGPFLVREVSPYAYVWQTPAQCTFSEAARRVAREADAAVRRFSGKYVEEPMAATDYMLDPETVESELRAFAAAKGINIDAWADEAGRHFQLPDIQRRTEPLSDQELEILFEDDQRALDR